MVEHRESAQKVSVIDSGVGGQTVAQKIRELLPDVVLTYHADSKNFPYGSKDDATIVQVTTDFAVQICTQENPDILVVACNTMSTIALEAVRGSVVCPVVGVVPAIKPAAQISSSRHIALLATPATIRRKYVDDLIDAFAQNCRVTRHGSLKLVQIAEDKFAGHKFSVKEVAAEIAPVISSDIDVVVLGCTHFPLLREEFERISGPRIQWLDSGASIAKRVQSLLQLDESR